MFSDNSVYGVREYFIDKLADRYLPREVETFFEWSCHEKFNLNKSDILLNDRKFSDAELEVFKGIVKDLQAFKPIQYILGKAYFLDLELKVGRGVLCPRPETEELAALIVKENVTGSLLDIGTGSGAIPLAVKLRRNEIAVTGLENSVVALEYAKENAVINELEANWIQMDIMNEYPQQQFDIVVSNPPYIPEADQAEMSQNVLQYEPWEALFVPDEDPFKFYARIAEICNYILSENGTLYFEIHEKMGEQLVSMLINSYNFTDVELIKDLQGKDRIIKAKKAPPL